MSKDTTKAAPAKDGGAKPKRKQLTAEERVAKLEAELAAARKKAEEKAKRATTILTDRRDKLVARRDKLNGEIAEVEAEIERLNPSEPTSDDEPAS